MSSGHIIEDSSYRLVTGCGPSSIVHRVFEKTWSGTNGKRHEEHPYNCVVSVVFDTPITWAFAYNPGYTLSGTPSSCGFAPTWQHGEITADQEYTLINSISDSVRGHQFNAAVNIGEAKESVKLIGSTARSLASSFLSLRRGDPVSALKHLGLKPRTSVVRDVTEHLRLGAGSAWLGLTYGWKPLLGAAYDAGQAAGAQLRPRRSRFQARVGVNGDVFGSGGGFSATGYARRSVNLIWIVEEDQQFTTLEEFGFMDPELVAWELMPYSFVVDWFLPIGNFLQARSSLNRLSGTFVRTKRDFASASLGTSPSYIIRSGSSIRREIRVTRTVGAIESMPLPRPTLKNPLNISHAISGIALLQNAFEMFRKK